MERMTTRIMSLAPLILTLFGASFGRIPYILPPFPMCDAHSTQETMIAY